MTISSQLSGDGKRLIITVGEKFDFGSHQIFRQQYEEIAESSVSYIIDLHKTRYMDSSALGMMLLLRDHAGGETSDVKLVNANEDIFKILKISNFHQLFEID